MASSLDTIGHFTKTVYDSALILNVTAGHDNYDATTPNIPVTDYTRDIQKGIKGIKIGIPREYFIKGIDQAVEKSVKTAIKKMEGLGGKLVEISLPHTEYALAVYYIVQPSEVSSNLARYDGIRYGKGRETFGDEAKRRIILGTYTLSAGYYDAYYLQAMKARTLIKKDFESAFKKVDVIIAPVSPTPPFKLGEKSDDPLAMYLADIFTVTANLAGIPSLAVPCGFTGKLPVGMQIMGSHFNEGLLFRVGFAYEQATDWHRRKPNLEGNL
jgi:aspartyl-tRNA(Asn)/glutamyl-tRNA(Gln) amidotransferase subunit A